MEPMGDELRSNGLEVIGGTNGDPEYDDEHFSYEKIPDFKWDEDVGAVITGIDFKFNYSKIALASMYIQRCKKWIVTNEDAFTMQHGYRAPGNGCIIAALEYSLRKPGSQELICDKVVTGKPNPAIIDLIRGQHNIPDSDLCKMIMIGDRPDTDIALGNNSGIASCLVLSGVCKNEEEVYQYAKQASNMEPTYVIDSFG